MTFKEKIHVHCISLVNKKIQELENILKELDASAASDTKSSAGDKHETARAMVQIEQENTDKQLQDAQDQKIQLERITTENNGAPSPLSLGEGQGVRSGSLVKTNKGYLYLCIALGKIKVEKETIMVLSPQSPLGMKLMGLNAGSSAEINGVGYVVECVY